MAENGQEQPVVTVRQRPESDVQSEATQIAFDVQIRITGALSCLEVTGDG